MQGHDIALFSQGRNLQSTSLPAFTLDPFVKLELDNGRDADIRQIFQLRFKFGSQDTIRQLFNPAAGIHDTSHQKRS